MSSGESRGFFLPIISGRQVVEAMSVLMKLMLAFIAVILVQIFTGVDGSGPFPAAVRAAAISQAYNNLKANFPETIARLKAADPAVTDAQIESFVNDIGGDLQSRGTLTEANIESMFFNSALSVILSGRHDRVVNAALSGFGVTMEDIMAKRVPPGLQDIKEALKMELLSGPVPSGGGGGGGLMVDKVEPSVPENAIPDRVLDEAINRSAGTGIVKITAADQASGVVFSSEQLVKTGAAGRPLEVAVQGVSFSFPAGVLEAALSGAPGAVQVQLGVRRITGTETGTVKGARYRVAGDVYELTVQVAGPDGTMIDAAEFASEINVQLPVPAGYGGIPGDLKVFRLNEEAGIWTNTGGVYNPDSGAVAFSTRHFCRYVLVEVKRDWPPVVFTDTKGHWAEKEILQMSARGVLRGAGGRAMPGEKVTRSQFAAFLVLLLGIDGTGGELPFSDAERPAWYYSSLSAAYRAGLVNGYGDGRIGPDDYISREQLAVMIAGALKLAGSSQPSGGDLPFSDKSHISAWSSGPVSAACSMKIISGYPDGSFRPGEMATRAEALVMLSRLAGKL